MQRGHAGTDILQGYETVAGLGKTGYNIGSGIGGALSGKSGKEDSGDSK